MRPLRPLIVLLAVVAGFTISYRTRAHDRQPRPAAYRSTVVQPALNPPRLAAVASPRGFGVRLSPPAVRPAPPPRAPAAPPPVPRPGGRSQAGFGVRPTPARPPAPPAPEPENGPRQGEERSRRGPVVRGVPIPVPYFYGPFSPYFFYGDRLDRYGNPLPLGSFGYPGPLYPYSLEDTGEIAFRIRPDSARVYLDGQYVGLAGNIRHLDALENVVAGAHVVTAELAGYRPLRRDVVVRSDHLTTVRASLRRE